CRYCAFLSHVLDVGQSGERFARDLLDAEIAALDLAAQAGYAYASIWKRNLRRDVETERRRRGDLVGGWDALRYLRLVLLWLFDGAAELGGRLGLGHQPVRWGDARPRGCAIEAKRRPRVGGRAGAVLPLEQQPVRFGLRGKVLGSAAGRVRDGNIVA